MIGLVMLAEGDPEVDAPVLERVFGVTGFRKLDRHPLRPEAFHIGPQRKFHSFIRPFPNMLPPVDVEPSLAGPVRGSCHSRVSVGTLIEGGV